MSFVFPLGRSDLERNATLAACSSYSIDFYF
jgi:hypothetical protein